MQKEKRYFRLLQNAEFTPLERKCFNFDKVYEAIEIEDSTVLFIDEEGEEHSLRFEQLEEVAETLETLEKRQKRLEVELELVKSSIKKWKTYPIIHKYEPVVTEDAVSYGDLELEKSLVKSMWEFGIRGLEVIINGEDVEIPQQLFAQINRAIDSEKLNLS